MESIYLLTVRTLHQNRKRTWITIFTIMLSVAMLTAVLNGSWSVLSYMREKEKVYSGDYVYSVTGIDYEQAVQLEEGENVDSVALCTFVGSGFIGEKSNKSQVAIARINESFIANFSMTPYLESGRFPANDSEIVVLSSFLQKNGLSWKVGDRVTVCVGERIWDEVDGELYGLTNYMGERESFHPEETKEYTVVGLLSDVDELKIPQMFNIFSGINADAQEKDLTAYVKSEKITKSVYEEAKQNVSEVSAEEPEYNEDLLKYYGVSDSAMLDKVLLALCISIVLLMVASAAVIGNIMSISLQERLRQLGLLSSIGATRKQKRASVVLEAVLLGTVAIPLGLLLGVGLTASAIAVIRNYFENIVSFGTVGLRFEVQIGILVLSAIVGILSLVLASIAPQKMAARVTVMDVLRQTQIYQMKKNIYRKGKGLGLLFGIYGSLAAKNINRNPKRFKSIALSIFVAVVMSLSLYSLADFMVYISSMDMKEDGSCYVDVISGTTYSDVQNMVLKLSQKYPSADAAWTFSSYMLISVPESMVNPEMKGYCYDDEVELYVVGMDETHMAALCEERGINPDKYTTASNYGILFNYATGQYDARNSRICSGAPLNISAETQLQLDILNEDASSAVIVGDVIERADAEIQSRFVPDRCVLVVPISYYHDWLSENDYSVAIEIKTKQHQEVTDYLADMGYFMTYDKAQETQSIRQIFLMVKLAVCVFAFMMTIIIGLSVCNTIANTIYVRKGEFAVLQSIGMTEKGLKKTLLLEAVLYGGKALLAALPVSYIIHCAIYKVITMADNPLAFYINGWSYVVAVIAVAVIVVSAMLFSLNNLGKIDIIKESKME